MVIIHENEKKWKVQLRGMYAGVRSEKAFRAMIAKAIETWKKRSLEYGESLEKKPLFEVCRIFGIITAKWEVK